MISLSARKPKILIAGAGLVGLAAARALAETLPGAAAIVLEKEGALASHQSGRNSGVLHAGLAYKPGSTKARLAFEGARAMLQFCRDRGVACEQSGKLVVAISPEQIPALEALAERGRANGLTGLRLMEPAEFREREPHAAGVRGLLVPEEGVVDFAGVARALRQDIEAAGGAIHLSAEVRALHPRQGGGWIAETPAGAFEGDFLVNAAGLWSDRVARLAGEKPPARIIPFRGQFYRLKPERAELCHHSIYPVADPRLPFLGVHLTRRVDGTRVAGPNAVLALARSGYRARDISLRDAWETLTYPGFWRLARRYARVGAWEAFRSASRAAFCRELRKIVPEVNPEDLEPAPSGVRAQAVLPDGTLFDDFLWVDGERAVHVINAPSPAATACLAIGKEIAGKVLEKWEKE
jgi:L-2-hydroxyglutarate oxidase